MPDVGIVMPVYNQLPKYLTAAIQSIFKQSYGDYLLVIVIDGANEATRKVVKELTRGDSRVHIINKEKNEGVAKALNTGFQALMPNPNIQFLTWVSSDNIYYPTFIEQLRNALLNAPQHVGFAYSSFRHIDANGKPLEHINLEEFIRFQNQPKDKLIDYCFVGVSFMYKKEYAKMIEGYSLEPVEDYEYWLRLMEKCDIVYVPKILMDYRQDSPNSISLQLKSRAQHRRWRYAFNLAKQQARNRRAIPFEATILFPVGSQTTDTVNKFEQLLEQTFSNYKLIIIDYSPNQRESNVLKHISDPRVSFFYSKSQNEQEILKEFIYVADTPYTLLYGKGKFPSDIYVLENMISTRKKRDELNIPKTSYAVADIGGGHIQIRNIEADRWPIYGDLYDTNKAKQLLNNV